MEGTCGEPTTHALSQRSFVRTVRAGATDADRATGDCRRTAIDRYGSASQRTNRAARGMGLSVTGPPSSTDVCAEGRSADRSTASPTPPAATQTRPAADKIKIRWLGFTRYTTRDATLIFSAAGPSGLRKTSPPFLFES